MITARLLLAAALAAAAVAGPADAAPARKEATRPAARDWSRTIVATAEGGYRMGNPAAPVKLVEYGSLTCPHCAQFTNEAKGPLATRVRTGKVSYEFRNYVLNGIDVTASLLARCAGPRGFFGMAETLYATQTEWMGRVTALPQDQKAQLRALGEGDMLARIAEIAGLTQVAARHGVPASRARQCLVDKAGVDRLDAMAAAAEALGVTGTPTFFLNGRRLEAGTWVEVDTAIRRAGG